MQTVVLHVPLLVTERPEPIELHDPWAGSTMAAVFCPAVARSVCFLARLRPASRQAR